MIKIGILGDIGSGKSYVAKKFGYPVFNADLEVSKLYQKDKKIFDKLKIKLPNYIFSFPIKKNEISKAILSNKSNLKKIIKIVHHEPFKPAQGKTKDTITVPVQSFPNVDWRMTICELGGPIDTM